MIDENNTLLIEDDKYGLDIDVSVNYGTNIKFIPYEGMDDE